MGSVISGAVLLAVAGICFSLGVVLTSAAFLFAIWRDKHPDPEPIQPKPYAKLRLHK